MATQIECLGGAPTAGRSGGLRGVDRTNSIEASWGTSVLPPRRPDQLNILLGITKERAGRFIGVRRLNSLIKGERKSCSFVSTKEKEMGGPSGTKRRELSDGDQGRQRT